MNSVFLSERNNNNLSATYKHIDKMSFRIKSDCSAEMVKARAEKQRESECQFVFCSAIGKKKKKRTSKDVVFLSFFHPRYVSYLSSVIIINIRRAWLLLCEHTPVIVTEDVVLACIFCTRSFALSLSSTCCYVLNWLKIISGLLILTVFFFFSRWFTSSPDTCQWKINWHIDRQKESKRKEERELNP